MTNRKVEHLENEMNQLIVVDSLILGVPEEEYCNYQKLCTELL